MARNCGWCTHRDRLAWERRALSGESIRQIASSTPYSEAAARRHLVNHLGAHVLADLAAARDMQSRAHLADFVARLVGIADDAESIRTRALLAGDGRLALRAGAVEAGTLTALIARLGVSDEDTADTLLQAQQLARALGAVLHRGRPDLARELADELDSLNEPELSASFRALARDIETTQPRRIGASA